ncbi:MAG: hypothetical protein ACE5HS_12915 [bacterium]
MNKPFHQPAESQSHSCFAVRDGDWIIFRCSICADYERRINWRTGKMKVHSKNSAQIRHNGVYLPNEYKEVYMNSN